MFSTLFYVRRLKQYNDAGAMYIKAGQYDKAAGVFIHAKNFTAVTPLLDKITLPKLHAQYAKVCGIVLMFVWLSG